MDEPQITAVYKLGNLLAIELDEGETDLLVFEPSVDGPPRGVAQLEGDWRRVWP